MTKKAIIRKERTPESLELTNIVNGLNRGQLVGLVHYLVGACTGSDGTDAESLAFVKQAIPSIGRPEPVGLPDVRPEYGAILEAIAHLYLLRHGFAPMPNELAEAAVEGFAWKILFDNSEGGARRLQRSYGWTSEQVDAMETARADVLDKVKALGDRRYGPIRFA